MFCKKTLILTVFTLLLVSTAMATTTPNSSTTIQQMNQMPPSFTKNMGQWDDRVLFRANAGGATMWFTKEGVTYQFTRAILRRGDPSGRPDRSVIEGDSPSRPYDPDGCDSVEQLVLTAKFLGANPNPEIIAEGQMEYKCNYFLGNDPTKWHTDVPNYEAITLKDIYPGIDLRYSSDGQPQAGHATYEFVVAPGADIAQIKVEYEGTEKTSIDADGRLVLKTQWGDMVATIKTPTNGVLSGTTSFSQVSEKTIGFEACGASRQVLGTLSVGLVYSTYLGGGDSDAGREIAVDGSGSAYVSGYTSSTNFPTLNPYQTDQGNQDVFVTKLSSFGNSLIYSTYLGGAETDFGWGITVDGSGDAYVTGYTYSPDFPTLNPYQTYQGTSGYADAFITKLSSLGNSLIYSTYFGAEKQDVASGIVVDGSGNAYVTGTTGSSNFPTLNPYQTDQVENDVFVAKLSSTGNSLIYSTYLGGGDLDAGLDIAVDGSGSAYVSGYTFSTNFPTLNPYQTDQGFLDVFVTKLSSSGNSLIYSTYLGGTGDDYGLGIRVDGNGDAYVTGHTYSSNFPTRNPNQTYQGNQDVFVTKLSSSGNSLIYSTYLGGGNSDQGFGVAVDGGGKAYVTGGTYSPDFPTQNAYQTYQGDRDVFVTKLSSLGNSLTYSTCLGGGGFDHGFAIAVDDNDNAYVIGQTSSSNFPTLNPYQGTLQGGDAFVTKLSETTQPDFCDGFQGVFCDDFEDGVTTIWQTLLGNCTWSESNGEFSCSNSGSRIWCFHSVGDPSWSNYVFEGLVKGISGVDKVFIFRIKDRDNFYGFDLRSDWNGQDEVTFNKMENGIYGADLVTAQYPSQNGVWYYVKIVCVGNEFTMFVNGVQVLQYSDPVNPYFSGGIGVACWTGDAEECNVRFDNVEVTDPFPHITFDNVAGASIGNYLEIEGRVKSWDGSVFGPLSPGLIVCEDPVSQMSRNVAVDNAGMFLLTTNSAVAYPALYDFKFAVLLDGHLVEQHLFVPVTPDPDPTYPAIESGVNVAVGATNAFPSTNTGIAVQEPPTGFWGAVEAPTLALAQLAKTAWQKATHSPDGKIITGLRNWTFGRCSWSPTSWGNCYVGANIFGIQVLQATEPFNLLSSAFTMVWNHLEEKGHLTHSQNMGLSMVMGWAGVVQGIWKITKTKKIIDGVQAAGLLADALLSHEVILRKIINPVDGSVTEILVQIQDQSGDCYTIMVFPKLDNVTTVSSWCPVDLVVTDAHGLIVSKNLNEITNAEYLEFDFDNDGKLEDFVILPGSAVGQYGVTVIPDSTALPTDSFSLFVDNSFYADRSVLADKELVANIPTMPYTFETFSNLPPIGFDGISPDDTTIAEPSSIVFTWHSSSDPNPGHIVSYDLLISPDTSFEDTLVIHDLADTAVTLTDNLPDDLFDQEFYWKVRAHDLWGASTYSSQVYMFRLAFVCGDANGDTATDISDVVYLIAYIFSGGAAPDPLDAGDANCDGFADISDVVYLIAYIFSGGAAPCAVCI